MTFFFVSRLYDEGHDIVGIEISEIAIQEFFTESELQYTIHDVQNLPAKMYKVRIPIILLLVHQFLILVPIRHQSWVKYF